MTFPAPVWNELERLCEIHHVAPSEVLGRRKYPSLVMVRHKLWHYLREVGWSYPYIARHFGVDHTTVISGVRRIERLYAEDFPRLRIAI